MKALYIAMLPERGFTFKNDSMDFDAKELLRNKVLGSPEERGQREQPAMKYVRENQRGAMCTMENIVRRGC